MDDVTTLAAYSSRLLPYDSPDAVRLAERLRARCGGLLVAENLSLRFLEHVTGGQACQLRLRDATGLSLPAALEIRPWDEDWCELRVAPRVAVLGSDLTTRQVNELADASADLLCEALLGNYERRHTE